VIGVAAELEVADFINAGAKTADEIAKAGGLHATSLYWLLQGLATYRIFGSRCTTARAASRATVQSPLYSPKASKGRRNSASTFTALSKPQTRLTVYENWFRQS
jgi:hypothetical protein